MITVDTTTEVRCTETDLIAYSCAHCRGHVHDVDTITDYNELPEELAA